MNKLSSILLALTLGFGTIYAETVTIKQSSTITQNKIVELSKDELAEVNKLSSELKNSGLSIKDLESGKAITADQATKLNRIVAIIEKNNIAAAAVGSSAAGITAGTVTSLSALSAALLTAIALGSSDSSASTHSHH